MARFLSLFGVALACLGGCTIPGGAPYDQTPRMTKARVEPVGITVIPSGPTIAGGNLARIEAENPYGSIRIYVDRSLSAPTVTIKPIVSAGLSRGEVRAIEENLVMTAETVLEDHRMVLRAGVEVLDGDEDIRVDLLIRTPDSEITIARNANGSIELVGIGGQIVASSGEMNDRAGGDILIRTNSAVEGPVHLSTTLGDINVFIPGGSDGSLELTSDDGTVMVNVESGSIRNAMPKDGYYTAILNSGTNTFYVRTNRGRISLNVEDKNWEASGPFSYSRTSRDR